MDNDEDKKEAAIQALHAYRDSVLAQIKNMEDNVRTLEKSIELLSGNGSVVVSPVPATAVATTSSLFSTSRYADLRGQAAVELFLQENPGKWFKASTVAKELLRRGMPKRAKAFSSGITCSLNRAADKGLAIKEKRNKVFKYRSAEEPQKNEETKQ